ncbi:serine/threonine-protein kinase [Jiella pacifica]|uniref:Protein kinase n=1 Tax=Jiella pacifica TaxID=2696469 RepID=A0A6N9T3J3_9HYPH|nr:serine/threonine-protein kinase [Jiella pacifica]NDW05830.1 protein kinase [Jiella pacifica]
MADETLFSPGERGSAPRTEAHRPAARLEPGTELNDTYVVEALLATGGMGEVYRGRNLATGETVAIKVILPEFAGDPTFMRLFLREAETLARLNHDAIVRSHVMTIDRRLNRAYFAMEFVEGRSLKEIASQAPLKPEAVRLLLLRLASGLDVAHRAGIVHRDLSPDNVILPEGDVERAKLIDFGIAKSARPGDNTILGDSFAGKDNFVSPEQLGDFGGDVTGRSDVYSLALVAVAALRGRPLDMGGSDFDRLDKRRRVPDLADVPPPLRGLLDRMLQPDPESRPDGMAEVCVALIDMEGELSGEGPVARGWHPGRSRGGAMGVAPQHAGLGAEETPAGKGRAAASRPTDRASRGPGSRGGRWMIVVACTLSAFAILAVGVGWLWPDVVFSPSSEVADGGAPADLVAERIGTAPDEAADADTPAPTQRPLDDAADRPQPRPLQAESAEPAATAEGDRQAMLGDPARPDGDGLGQPARPAPLEPSQKPDAPDHDGERQPDPSLPDEIGPLQDSGEALDDTARFVDFIQRFDGGSCFYAIPADVADTAVRIEAYGGDVVPAERLLRQFQVRFGIEPDIGFRPVTERQCAALDFAAERRTEGGDRAAIALREDIVASGETVRARIEGLGASELVVLFVDGRGFVQDASAAARRRGDTAELGLVAHLDGDAPEQHLMLAMTSTIALGPLLPKLPAQAASVFARLDERLKQKAIGVSVNLKSLRIGR